MEDLPKRVVAVVIVIVVVCMAAIPLINSVIDNPGHYVDETRSNENIGYYMKEGIRYSSENGRLYLVTVDGSNPPTLTDITPDDVEVVDASIPFIKINNGFFIDTNGDLWLVKRNPTTKNDCYKIIESSFVKCPEYVEDPYVLTPEGKVFYVPHWDSSATPDVYDITPSGVTAKNLKQMTYDSYAYFTDANGRLYKTANEATSSDDVTDVTATIGDGTERFNGSIDFGNLFIPGFVSDSGNIWIDDDGVFINFREKHTPPITAKITSFKDYVAMDENNHAYAIITYPVDMMVPVFVNQTIKNGLQVGKFAVDTDNKLCFLDDDNVEHTKTLNFDVVAMTDIFDGELIGILGANGHLYIAYIDSSVISDYLIDITPTGMIFNQMPKFTILGSMGVTVDNKLVGWEQDYSAHYIYTIPGVEWDSVTFESYELGGTAVTTEGKMYLIRGTSNGNMPTIDDFIEVPGMENIISTKIAYPKQTADTQCVICDVYLGATTFTHVTTGWQSNSYDLTQYSRFDPLIIMSDSFVLYFDGDMAFYYEDADGEWQKYSWSLGHVLSIDEGVWNITKDTTTYASGTFTEVMSQTENATGKALFMIDGDAPFYVTKTHDVRMVSKYIYADGKINAPNWEVGGSLDIVFDEYMIKSFVVTGTSSADPVFVLSDVNYTVSNYVPLDNPVTDLLKIIPLFFVLAILVGVVATLFMRR